MPTLNDPLLPDDDLGRGFEERAGRHLHALIEAVLFASPEPVTVSELARSLGEPERDIHRVLEELAAD